MQAGDLLIEGPAFMLMGRYEEAISALKGSCDAGSRWMILAVSMASSIGIMPCQAVYLFLYRWSCS
jgi:hypothetical protein